MVQINRLKILACLLLATLFLQPSRAQQLSPESPEEKAERMLSKFAPVKPIIGPLIRKSLELHYRYIHTNSVVVPIDVAKDILPFLLAAAVSVGVAYAVALPVGNIYVSTAVRIVVTALLYIAIMKVSKARIFSECMDFVLRHQPFK